jgi:UDP-N-acetyl-D-galactosamine dehydrogenase
VVSALEEYGILVTIYDPWANPAEVMHEYKLTTSNVLPYVKYDTIVLGVAHKEFFSLDLASLQKENNILYDVKGILEVYVDGKL